MRNKGKLLSMSTAFKRASQRQVTDLLDKIKLLESAHTKTQAMQTLVKLQHARSLLLELGKRYKRCLIQSQSLFYEEARR